MATKGYEKLRLVNKVQSVSFSNMSIERQLILLLHWLLAASALDPNEVFEVFEWKDWPDMEFEFGDQEMFAVLSELDQWEVRQYAFIYLMLMRYLESTLEKCRSFVCTSSGPSNEALSQLYQSLDLQLCPKRERWYRLSSAGKLPSHHWHITHL